jgi:hypothetical protein
MTHAIALQGRFPTQVGVPCFLHAMRDGTKR